MSRTSRYASIADLPKTLPIFPLPGVLLLPRGRLPLNIFEPRYLAMTGDALGGDRLIGMVQPTDPNASLAAIPSGPQTPVYPIGCAGRITQWSETEDGRYLITLIGICRFVIASELPVTPSGYRRIATAYDRFADDLVAPGEGAIDRARLVPALKSFFARRQLKANWEAIEKASDDGLVTALAMVCPFEPSEKQALLESPDVVARARLLQALLEMGQHAQGAGSDAKPQ